jgi:acyl carrier protein
MSVGHYRTQIIATLASMGQLADERRLTLQASADRDLAFVDLEMDSLTALDFCVSLEDTIQRTIEPADLVEHPSVNALARHLAGSAPPPV